MRRLGIVVDVDVVAAVGRVGRDVVPALDLRHDDLDAAVVAVGGHRVGRLGERQLDASVVRVDVGDGARQIAPDDAPVVAVDVDRPGRRRPARPSRCRSRSRTSPSMLLTSTRPLSALTSTSRPRGTSMRYVTRHHIEPINGHDPRSSSVEPTTSWLNPVSRRPSETSASTLISSAVGPDDRHRPGVVVDDAAG